MGEEIKVPAELADDIFLIKKDGRWALTGYVETHVLGQEFHSCWHKEIAEYNRLERKQKLAKLLGK